jgi:hypothetical protein
MIGREDRHPLQTSAKFGPVAANGGEYVIEAEWPCPSSGAAPGGLAIADRQALRGTCLPQQPIWRLRPARDASTAAETGMGFGRSELRYGRLIA